jgi:hypothetical protein
VAAKKRVLLTVNPFLVTGKRMMTQRSLVTALDRHADLVVATAGDYDFANGLVRAYRRTRGGRFDELGMIAPAADLWIVYSDGYYLDHRVLGFARRRDFFHAQLDFHHRQLATANVGRIINEPAVETRTLKSWLASLDCAQYLIIPTRLFSSIDEVYDFRKDEGAIVAKLDWGGSGTGAHRLLNENDVRCFARRLVEDGGHDLGDYCFQPYRPGDEKRMWFAGGRFVAGRKRHGGHTPWSDNADDYEVYPYDSPGVKGFAADLEAAERLLALCGLSVGSIDFIGENINEINGCGTIFTEYKNWKCIVDARPALVRYFLELLPTL